MKTINKPLISIIISTKNEAANIYQLLFSLTKQTYSNIEIILVDNHSTDNTLKITGKFTQKIFTYGPERSQQRNFGAKKAKGKFLLFLDADMYLPKNIVFQLVEKMHKKNCAGVIIPEDVYESSFFTKIKKLEKRIYWNESSIEAVRGINKKIFDSINGYNEKLVAGEDWDLHIRLSKKGKIYRLQVPLFHNEYSLLNELKKKIYYSVNIRKYANLHPKEFKQQSGINRFKIILKKNDLLLTDIPLTICLIILKSVEYILYLVIYCSSIFLYKNEKKAGS